MGILEDITDQDGRATFLIEAGSYILNVKVDGTVKYETEIDVTKDEVVEVFLNLVANWRELNPFNELYHEFDFVGERHNLILEGFDEQRPDIDNVFDIVNFTADYAFAQGFLDEDFLDEAIVSGTVAVLISQQVSSLPPWPNWEDIIDLINDILDQLKSTVNEGIVDGDLKVSNQELALDYLDKLSFDILSRFNDESVTIMTKILNTVDDTEEGLVLSAIGRLKELDAEINTEELLDEEKRALSVSNAVARYSTAFWIADLNDDESIWPKAANGNRARWRRIIGRDLVGGLTGYLTGNWGGAIIGAAASSIDEAIKED